MKALQQVKSNVANLCHRHMDVANICPVCKRNRKQPTMLYFSAQEQRPFGRSLTPVIKMEDHPFYSHTRLLVNQVCLMFQETLNLNQYVSGLGESGMNTIT